MQITIAALSTALDVRVLAHDVREVSDHLDLLADMLQFPEPDDPGVQEVQIDLVRTAKQMMLTASAIQMAAESIGHVT